MAKKDLTSYFLYRFRYVIGYSLIGILLAGLLIFTGLYLPGGLSSGEMNSAVTTSSLSIKQPGSLTVADLPYHLAQRAIFSFFGVSELTIKILSLALALLTVVGFIILLRRWFKPNIAVIASLVAISTSQFLYFAQSGTPDILLVFWPTILLLVGTQITRGKHLHLVWCIIFASVSALCLYTPLSIYPLLAVLFAISLHPHLRNAVRKLPRPHLYTMAIIFLLLISPLVYIAVLSPNLLLTLLGLPPTFDINLAANAIVLLKQYLFFWSSEGGTIIAPVFGLGSALLIALGLTRLIRTINTTRSYLVLAWLICLIPVLLLNPSFTTVLFVPSVMMLAAGFMSLLSYWYRLFPLNPYARVAGLVPIVILVGTLIVGGLTRYTYSYHYNPNIAPLFSHDLELIPSTTDHLVVGDKEYPFYNAVSRFNDGPNVTTTAPAKDAGSFVATRAAKLDIKGYSIKSIITNSNAGEADRLYVYQKQQ